MVGEKLYHNHNHYIIIMVIMTNYRCMCVYFFSTKVPFNSKKYFFSHSSVPFHNFSFTALYHIIPLCLTKIRSFFLYTRERPFNLWKSLRYYCDLLINKKIFCLVSKLFTGLHFLSYFVILIWIRIILIDYYTYM